MTEFRMPALAPALLLLSAALLSACAGGGSSASSSSGGSSAPDPVRTSSSSGDPLGGVEIPEIAGEDERMQIGMEATRGLNDFVASDRVVLGERTVVDLTRTPFLAMSAFTVNPDDVERRESRDDANGVLTITLTNRTGVKTHFPALPRVEIGGLLFVGVEQLVLRYSMRADARTPIFLRAVAENKALYRHETGNRRERGQRVTMEMRVDGVGDAARFTESVRVDP
jgi:hypothetical protein